jgi:hypothetical protein
MDYAGRSAKGQFTQAGRLRSGRTVVVDGDRATVREHGRGDWSAPLEDVVERIST